MMAIWGFLSNALLAWSAYGLIAAALACVFWLAVGPLLILWGVKIDRDVARQRVADIARDAVLQERRDYEARSPSDVFWDGEQLK